MRRATPTSQRGVSLVEAIVAMAVMAFGMLAIVGLQSTLRQNADIAKQRSEAVRIAEEAIETWRGYAKLPTTSGFKAYDDLALGALPDVTLSPAASNATFTLRQTVVAAAPGLKSLRAEVLWTDRNGQPQSIVLSTLIAGVDPALSGRLTMADAGGAAPPPQGRNAAIPVVAKDLGNGMSGFKLQAPGDVVWVFDNLSGVIVGVCNSITTGQASLTAADVSACMNDSNRLRNGLPLSGFVRFATDDPPNGATTHSAAVAENPPNTALNLSVVLTLSSTGHTSQICYADAPTSASPPSPPPPPKEVPYFCAVFFADGAPRIWSGISEVMPLPFQFDLPLGYVPWELATNAADARASRFRICRYTPATSDGESIPNHQHPRNYINAKADEPLVNQNFLVIRAGNGPDSGGGAVFTCPTDVAADPAHGDFVNSNTLVHQPAPPSP